MSLGILGFLVSFIGSWIPSYWGDEAASIMSAERSLPSLFRMLGHVDAVHGTYYVFLHFWIGAFGASEISTRLPSAIAAGLIVVGTYFIGKRVASRSLGVVAAVVCAVLPRIDYLGAETRSYAFSTAIAVWMTVLLLELLRRRTPSKRLWLAYALGMTVGLYVFLYLGLLLVVHGAYVFTSRRFAPVRRRWVQAALVAVILSLPIVWYGYQERGQIAFLAKREYLSVVNVLVFQWFGNGYLAAAAWALVVFAVVMAVITWRRWHERSDLVVLTVLWTVIPTLGMILLNIATPTYNMRYVSFSAPALALLVVAGAFRLRARWAKVAAVGVVVALSLPTDVGQREPYAMDQGSDLAQSAAIIGAEAHPGDGVIFDRTTLPSQRPRLALHLYPSDFTGLKDVTLKTSYLKRDLLWDTTWPLDEVPQRLNGIHTVWLLEEIGSKDNTEGTDVQTLEQLGYTIQSTQTVYRTIIYKFTEGS